jgi:ABC-type branched-subunit amino acid transport system substrate-binding protein
MAIRRVVALAAVAVLTAACGARLDAEQIAAVGAAGLDDGSGVVLPGGQTPNGGPGPAVTVAGAPSSPTPGGATDSSPGVTAPPVDGETPCTAPAAATTCTPQGAPDVGITENEITLGQVSTISGPVPGLAQTAVNGVRAYVAYRNATGGVCGRTLRVVNADDRLDTGQNRSETQRLMTQVFGFVGGWGVTDDGGASVLNGTNVPDVGIAISEARAALPNNFSSNPIEAGTSGATTAFRYILSAYQPASAAVVWPAQATARGRAQAFVTDLQALGVNVVVQREVSITETNWVPVAQEIEDAHAEFVITALEITQIARLAQAFDQIDYLPKVPFYGAQSYGPQFLQLAGPAAEGAILAIGHPIAEEAATAPGMATVQEWYQRANPGAPLDFFAFQGWVAADMFASAIEAAGPAPTRDAVLAVLRTYTSFDAHGLVAPIDPAEKRGSPCFLVITVHNGAWQRVFPSGGGYACP